jgi:hypothetical protein
VIAYRHVDPRWPFLWEDPSQPPGRWHGPGEGPVHYLSDTPDGAWAEFLRHEEITDPEDVPTIRRGMWAVEVPDETYPEPALAEELLTGPPESYPACQDEARRIRGGGAPGLVAPSAALWPGGATGWRVDRGLMPGPSRDGRTVALFGRRPDLVGWAAAAEGHPGEDVLRRVRHFTA